MRDSGAQQDLAQNDYQPFSSSAPYSSKPNVSKAKGALPYQKDGNMDQLHENYIALPDWHECFHALRVYQPWSQQKQKNSQ